MCRSVSSSSSMVPSLQRSDRINFNVFVFRSRWYKYCTGKQIQMTHIYYIHVCVCARFCDSLPWLGQPVAYKTSWCIYKCWQIVVVGCIHYGNQNKAFFPTQIVKRNNSTYDGKQMLVLWKYQETHLFFSSVRPITLRISLIRQGYMFFV